MRFSKRDSGRNTVNATEFRRMALAMEGAVEGAHMGHPDFRVNGRIFATLSADNTRGMVKLTPDQQEEFMRADPDGFEPASGAWGRQGCTMVRLASAVEERLGEAMTLAWQGTVKAGSTGSRRRAGKRQASRAGRATRPTRARRKPKAGR